MLVDIIIGLLLSAVISGVTSHTVPSLSLIILGVIGALLPDIDFIIWVIKQRGVINEWAHKHRDILHYPLLLIPAAFGMTLYFFGQPEAWLVSLGTLAHFIHDTMGIGGGIRWLWPFDNRFYYLEQAKQSWKLHKWTPQEQDAIARQRGNPNWIRDMYPPKTLITQISLILLLGLLFYLFS
jgi:hypothetical protein